MDAILGATGFVGSHIAARLPHAKKYNSKNLNLIENNTFRNVYCACIPAVKWKANANPSEDAQVIEDIKSKLINVSCEKIIVISTIDVTRDEPYGRHRLAFENWVSEFFSNVRIVRLPALFGIGLKKNALFDLLNSHRVEQLNMDDIYQWYDLRWLYDDIHETDHCELYTEPISMKEIIVNFFPHHIYKIKAKPLPTKYEFTPWVRSRGEVLANMEIFIKVWYSVKKNSNLLSVSSLQWKPEEDSVAFSILKSYNVNKIELAPGGYNPSWSEKEAKKLNEYFNENSFKISGIQGVFWNMVEDPMQRLHDASSVARALGTNKMVFGAPAFRSSVLESEFIDLLKNYSGYTKICIENVPRFYGGKFGFTFAQVCDIAHHSGQFVNLDLGNAVMENDLEYDLNHPLVKNIHVSGSSIEIGAFTSPGVPFTLEVNAPIEYLDRNLYNTFANFHTERCLVIGAGWYGCHTARLLKKGGASVDILDPLGIMNGSSLKNQNRLHKGYHYPRSKETIKECQLGYEKFITEYGHIVESTRSYYIISKDSLTSYDKFSNIFAPLHTVAREAITPVLFNWEKIQGEIIHTDEKVINPWKAREFWKNELGGSLISTVESFYDKIFDCTYGQLIPSQNFVYEWCVVGIVKLKVQCKSFGITIMDGPYFSLYPYDNSNNLYSLTHVVLTPVHKSVNADDFKISQDEGRKIVAMMESDARNFILNYDDLFEYVTFFTSVKTKIPNELDDRSLKYTQHGPRIHSFMGGKITGIFEVDNKLKGI
jgi:sugar phosphate isomerase/epimerase